MAAFGDFLNSQELNEQQMSFVHKVVSYIEENGYMEPVALGQAPFDRPQSFVKMFTRSQQEALLDIIKEIRSNAERPAA